MDKSAYMRTALSVAALEQFPPMVRQSLVSDRAFSKEYGLIVDANLSFGKAEVSMDRKSFFAVVRNSLANASTSASVKDTNGIEWSVSASEGDKSPIVSVSRAGRSFSVANMFVLSPSAEARLASLEKWATRIRPPSELLEKWRVIIGERPLDDQEVHDFTIDSNLTLVGTQQLIRSGIEVGSSDVGELVPQRAAYYEGLVGKFDGSTNIEDYAAIAAKSHVSKLVLDTSEYGISAALLMSSHSELVRAIPAEKLKATGLDSILASLETRGDSWSKLGVLELGLRILDNQPQIAPSLTKIVSGLLGQEGELAAGRFKLLSALFAFVDGELSRSKVLANKPPFWRRLAALAQASVIERELIEAKVEIEPFAKWAVQLRGQQFYMQSLCDLRLEPRWLPDFASDEQLKAEFAGRISAAARANQEKIVDGNLLEILLGEGEQSAASQAKFPFAYYAGPLEGGVQSRAELPSELKEDILGKLNAEHVNVSSFVTLVNSATVFQLDTSYADLAAKALMQANYRLKSGDQEPNWFALISGLAHVAALTRNTELAEGVWRLGRRWRQMNKYDSAHRWSEELLRVGMVCAAAHASLEPWCKVVGEYLTELAFQEESKEEGERLLAHIKVLLDIVPQLWITCGRAEAALRSFIG